MSGKAKSKLKIACALLFVFAFSAVVGPANGIYVSRVSMQSNLNYARISGGISVYHPEWIFGYKDGNFEVNAVPLEYPNIHYAVTNKVGDIVNEIATEYYLRVVAADGSGNIPIEYDVHEYNTPANVYAFETGVGYGPFALTADTASETFYSVRANWTSNAAEYKSGVQNMKVQMIVKRADNSLKVLYEAPLNMLFVNPSVPEKLKVYIQYYSMVPTTLLGQHEIEVPPGTAINFKDAAQMSSLGIVIPTGYYYHQASSELTSWHASDIITIPSDANVAKWIRVDCKTPGTADANKPVPAVLFCESKDAENHSVFTEVGTVTLTTDGEGKLSFTVESLRALNAAFSGKTSYAVCIRNSEGKNQEIGNPYVSATERKTITIEYSVLYNGSFSLALGMKVSIIAWW